MTEAVKEIVLPAIVEEAWKKFIPYCDAPDNIQHLLLRFQKTLLKTEGDAALEIGVRGGGTSAAMCHIAQNMPSVSPHFTIFSVDPYGDIPYRISDDERDIPITPEGTVLYYGDEWFTKQKKVLSQFPRNHFFPMESMFFLNYVLPHYYWHVRGKKYPQSKRFLSFVYIDGQHANKDVILEYLTIFDYVQKGGMIVFDDIQYIEEAIEYVEKTASKMRVEVERFPYLRVAVTRKT